MPGCLKANNGVCLLTVVLGKIGKKQRIAISDSIEPNWFCWQGSVSQDRGVMISFSDINPNMALVPFRVT